MRSLGVALAAALVLPGCADEPSSKPSRTDAVLYTIGLSTDPYGEDTPGGFGVATGLENGKLEKVEVREPGLGEFAGAEWLDGRTIVVPRPGPPLRRPAKYLYDGELKEQDDAPIPGGANYEWSPDQRLLAYEPPAPCRRDQRSLYACYRTSGRVFVARKDGSRRRLVVRGHLMGWTSDGRLVFFRSNRRIIPQALDIHSRRKSLLPMGPNMDQPVWSPDGRYVASVSVGGVVTSRADGTVIQRIRSKLTISMLAWSSVRNRLAFTTSGFPDPHELFVLDSPESKPRLLYETGDMHFDWITWSPDGSRLLLDEEHMNRWLLFDVRSGSHRELPRLGGRPLWCCPVNFFESLS